jgi:S1-C subfamily serine protease
MSGGFILDVLLVLLLIGYVVYGIQVGFLRSLGAILGVVAGAIAAFFVMPLVGAIVPSPEWRPAAVIGSAVLMILIGHTLGVTVARLIGRGVDRGPIRVIDRVLGGAVGLVVSALTMAAVAASIAVLGIPFLTPAIASSSVLSTIDSLTPPPAKSFVAQLRSLVLNQGIPRIGEAIDTRPEVPQVDTGNAAIATAARSVVRLTGAAYACGQNQTGTGFVIGPELVMTNAHVVAGVDEPLVETADGQVHSGDIVYFDPTVDLAIVLFQGLNTSPLSFAATLPAGASAVVSGFPFGGPFHSEPAGVVSVGPATMPDIYGESEAPRSVYTLAAKVEQGNSGGPLLTEDGAIAGVVFAKSAATEDVGYALTMEEVAPVIAQAPALTEPVDSGACIQG